MQNLSTQVASTNNTTQAARHIQPQAQQAVNNTLPQQYYAVQNPIPQPNAPQQSSGVNIVIYNPSVNPTAGAVANSNNNYAPQMAYPPNYYLQQPQPTPASTVAESYIANTPIKEETKTEAQKEPEKKEETDKESIVQLTDEYVKSLENYLNNQNPKIREMGMKELMARFKEHKSRQNDIALTNLLNKALQDGSKGVRFLALATLDAGYAQGDELTKQILQKMQASKEVFGEDAMMASEILLKTAGNKVEIDVPGPKPEEKDKKSEKKAKKEDKKVK